MSTSHIVKQGEHLSQIAFEAGFRNFEVIWNDPVNADLKKKRQNPNVLFPGDVVVIPERNTKQESAATDQRHRFKVTIPKLELRIRLLGLDSKPAAGVEVEVTIDGNVTPITTPGDGMIEQLLSPTARGGSIRFKDERTPFKQQIPIEVKVGHLDPVEEESGQRGRLNALGYEAGDPAKSGDGSLEFRSAVEEFQCDHGLKVDGVVGAQTRKKLQAVYGC
jgi:peptidoglycan hydrolase-like protein with peptidoglycan-binding domain